MNLFNVFKNKNACLLDVFLDLLQVKHTREFTSKYYEEHPHKYNLYGLSLMLSDYGIENAGIKVTDKESINQISNPFIAHLKSDKFAVVHNIANNRVDYFLSGDYRSVSIKEFIDIWSGTVLLAKSNEESMEPNYPENRKREMLHIGKNFLVVFCALFLMLSISKRYIADLGVLISLAINLLGSYIGYLLLLKQMKVQSNTAEKLCSFFKKSHCDDVLESEGARLFGVFSLSEIGFSYFFSNIIIILLFPEFISYLIIMNLCSLPFSFWSVWYQKFKAKQWCPICIIVISLFWIQFASNVFLGSISLFDINLFDIFFVGSIYILVCSFISIFVLKQTDYKKVDEQNYRINSIKANEEVFSALLLKQPYYKVDKSTSGLLFGNPNAKTLITLFSNPVCYSCGIMHARVDQLLKKSGDKFCVQYIFSSHYELSSKFLIAAYLRNEIEEAEIIFNKWFKESRHNKKYIDQFGYNMEDEDITSEYLSHDIWWLNNKLKSTPTILVNGYKLPDEYKIEDLAVLDI